VAGLTAKFDRTWKAMIRFRAKVGAARFRELMAELPSTIENISSSDQRATLSPLSSLGQSISVRVVTGRLEATTRERLFGASLREVLSLSRPSGLKARARVCTPRATIRRMLVP